MKLCFNLYPRPVFKDDGRPGHHPRLRLPPEHPGLGDVLTNKSTLFAVLTNQKPLTLTPSPLTGRPAWITPLCWKARAQPCGKQMSTVLPVYVPGVNCVVLCLYLFYLFSLLASFRGKMNFVRMG